MLCCAVQQDRSASWLERILGTWFCTNERTIKTFQSASAAKEQRPITGRHISYAHLSHIGYAHLSHLGSAHLLHTDYAHLMHTDYAHLSHTDYAHLLHIDYAHLSHTDYAHLLC